MLTLLFIMSLFLNVVFVLNCFKNKFRPENLIRAFTKRFKIFWKKISFSFVKSPGRPPISEKIKAIIKKMYFENIKIGGLRIYMNLIHLGFDISPSSVYRELRKIKKEYPQKPSQKWKTFLGNSKVIAMDFLCIHLDRLTDAFSSYLFL